MMGRKPARPHRSKSNRRNKSKTVESIVTGEDGFYDHPAWYDIVHAKGTAREARSLLRAVNTYYKGQPTHLLEPACGTGRYLRALARQSMCVHGYDIHQKMVDYAARALASAGPSATVEVGDMRSFVRPRRFDAAFNLINSFRLLMDDDAVLAHLDSTARCLKRGGLYVLGVDLASYDRGEVIEESWVGRRGRLEVKHLLVCLPVDRPTRRERLVNHITAVTPGRKTHLRCDFDLRAYDLAQWLELLARSPFHIRAVLDREWRRIELAPDVGEAFFVLARNADV